jgi:hypothetical protein
MIMTRSITRQTQTPDFAAFTPFDWSAYYYQRGTAVVTRAKRERDPNRAANLYATAAELFETAYAVLEWPVA